VIEATSCGGVVIFRGKILLLYKNYKNILKLIYGILVKRKIIIKGFNDGKIIEKIIDDAADLKNIKNIKIFK